MLGTDCVTPCYTIMNKNNKLQICLSPKIFKDILLAITSDANNVPDILFLTSSQEPIEPSIAAFLNDMAEQVVTPLLPKERQMKLNIPFSERQTVIASNLSELVTQAVHLDGRPLILHVERNEIGRLAEILLALQDDIGHVSIRLRDVHQLTEVETKEYARQLAALSDVGLMKSAAGSGGVLSILNLNPFYLEKQQFIRCSAGMGFMTIGPDGRVYPCPAFYYAGTEQALAPSIVAMTKESQGPKWNQRQCSFCQDDRCPGCPFLEINHSDSGKRICNVHAAEKQAVQDLLLRVAQSGHLFDSLRILKTREVASRSQRESGHAVFADHQVNGIVFDEFIQALHDLHTASELLMRDTANVTGFDQVLNRWSDLLGIPTTSQRSIFRRRVHETLIDLQRLNGPSKVVQSSSVAP